MSAGLCLALVWSCGALANFAALPSGSSPAAKVVQWRASHDGCPGGEGLVRVVDHAIEMGFDAERVRIGAELYGGPMRYGLELGVELDGVLERHHFDAADCRELEGYAELIVGLTLRSEWSLDEPLGSQPIEVYAVTSAPARQLQPPQGPPAPPPVESERGPVPLAKAAPELTALRPAGDGDGDGDGARTRTRDPAASSERSDAPPESLPGPRVRGALHVDALAVFNLFPTVGGGPRLRLGAGTRYFEGGLGVSGWLGGRFGAQEGAGTVHAWSSELYGCGLPVVGSWMVSVCASFGAGQMIGRGLATTNSSTRDALWLWAGGELRLGWLPRPSWGLELGLGIAGSLTRPAFHSLDARFIAGHAFTTLNLGLILGWGHGSK